MKIIEETVPLSTRIAKRLNNKLVKIAKLKKTTKAEVIRDALEKAVRNCSDNCK